MKKLVIIAVIPIVLFGCAVQNIPNDYVLQNNSPNGVAVISLTYSGNCVGGVAMYFGMEADKLIRLNSGELNLLDWGKWCEKDKSGWYHFPKGASQTEVGRLYVLELPAGNYTIRRVQVGMAFSGLITIPFSVLAGKVTYLGNVDIRAERIPYSATETVLGVLSGASGGSRFWLKMRGRDMRGRDLALLFERYANITNEQLVVKFPDWRRKRQAKQNQ